MKILSKVLRILNYAIALVGVYFMFSTVGALELDTITFADAFKRTLIAFACIGSAIWLHDAIRIHLD